MFIITLWSDLYSEWVCLVIIRRLYNEFGTHISILMHGRLGIILEAEIGDLLPKYCEDILCPVNNLTFLYSKVRTNLLVL